MREDVPRPLEDELVCPEVGGWAEDKHRLVSLYSALFSSGMKDKWNQRVYVNCTPAQAMLEFAVPPG